MTCGFEAYDTQCDDMIDIFVTGDNVDPIYNTGNKVIYTFLIHHPQYVSTYMIFIYEMLLVSYKIL